MKKYKVLILLALMATMVFMYNGSYAEISVSESMAWLDSLVGKTVGTGQCVALIQSYYNHLGAATVSGNACDYATNALPSGWTRVKGGVPEAGDILVYTGATYGHVAIYAGGTVSYHQNMAGKYVEKKTSWAYNNSWWSNAENGQKYYWGYIRPNWSVSTHTEDPAYASLKGTKVTASKEILVHGGNHVYYDRSTRRIDAGDVCTIEAIYTDGCCKVTYPSSSAPNGYRTLYAQKSDFNLPNPDKTAPSVTAASLEVKSTTLCRYTITATDNVGVDHVDFHTFYNSWTAEGDTICKAIRSGNNWYYDVPCDLSGYKVRIMDVRVYDAAGNQTLNASGYTVTNARLKYDKVTFDLAGGNCSESSRDVLYARCHLDGKTDTYVSTYGKLKALPTPTKTGYTFAGWYTDASGGTRVTDSTAVTSESNHTLYARWTPVTYAVTYNANAGSDTVTNMPTNQTKTYGVDLTLSGNTPKREGYIFLTWNDSSNNVWIYPNTVYKENAKLNLTAIWGKNGEKMETGAGRSYPDGDYLIFASEGRNGNYLLDIVGSDEKAAEGTNVNLHTSSGPAFDAWTLKYLDNGFYSICQKGTNMALTVADGSVNYRANIQVNTYEGRDSQQWSISEAYTGSVRKGMRISSRCSGYSIDISGGKTQNDANIIQWAPENNGNQSWVFEPYEPDHTLPDGRYILVANLEECYELDVAGDTGDIPDGQNAQIWNDSGDDYAEGALSQYNAFDVEYIGEGYYKLIHKVSGKALTVLEDSTEFNKNVVVSAYTGALGQQWAILQEEGAYILLARCSGYALEVQNANAENGAKVDQYRYINTPNKQWHLVPAEYTVQYSANGGSGAPEAQIKYYKGNLIISDEVPIREGYAFTGWNTKANGSGTAYAPGDVYRVDEAVTLYAQWRRLSVLKLPKGIKTIEEQAFAGVTADVIEIPEGCSSIGSEAFLNCKELAKLYIPASVKQITFDAFVGCDNLVIYAPEGSTAIQLAKRLNITYEITE